MSATIIVSFLVGLPLLALLVVTIAARQRAGRPPREQNSAPPTAEDLEALATNLLLRGALGRDEFRAAIETLAAADDIGHPVDIPQR